MNTADLVRMANQIASYYAGYPPQEAIDGVRGHLTRFWDPAMRRQLIDDLAAGRASLLPIARDAVAGLPAPGTGGSATPATT